MGENDIKKTTTRVDTILHKATDLDQSMLILVEDTKDSLPESDETSRDNLERVIALLQENAEAHSSARRLLRELRT